jgi:hypothetical protein
MYSLRSMALMHLSGLQIQSSMRGHGRGTSLSARIMQASLLMSRVQAEKSMNDFLRHIRKQDFMENGSFHTQSRDIEKMHGENSMSLMSLEKTVATLNTMNTQKH